MNTKDLQLPQMEVHKLLSCGNPDAALLYLYMKCGNPTFEAAGALNMNEARYTRAVATLRQFGLWEEDRLPMQPASASPHYTEEDVVSAMEHSRDFPLLVSEVQRALGRILTTEELKTILSLVNYLGLPPEVVSMLVCHCKERARRKGYSRNPSLRTIEKEAYAWADRGINSIQEAAAYMQADNARHTRMASLMRLLHIHDRPLTASEERFAESWLAMDFDTEALQIAYEKTCVNAGGLKWPYMNKILLSWHQQGLHTGAQVKAGDRGPQQKNSSAPQGLGQFEREAIARMLQNSDQEG